MSDIRIAFEDFFEVKEIDKNGKHFDKGILSTLSKLIHLYITYL